jgi:hypothetical protein
MLKVAVLCGMIICSEVGLKANSFTYTYSGPDFDPSSYYGVYSSGLETNISVSITLASPLGDNFAFGSVSPLSFEITDSFNTLTNTSPDLYTGPGFAPDLKIGTNDQGLIDFWAIDAFAQDGNNLVTILETSVVPDGPTNLFDQSQVCTGTITTPTFTCPSDGRASVTANPEFQLFWSGPGQTPEPSTWLSLVIGLGAVGVLVFKRRTSNEFWRASEPLGGKLHG